MNIKYLLIGFSFLYLNGCANTTMYHWGDYSDTLYSYTKEPSNESKSKHKAELTKIIAQAQQKNKMIPPGVNFELAMILATEGNTQEANKYFEQERTLFPESAKYVTLALKEMGDK